MAKRFRHKLSRVIPSLQFCRKTSAETPLPAIYRPSPVNSKVFDISFPSNLPAPPPSTPEYPLPKRHVSSKKVVSVECGCRSGSCSQDLSSVDSFPRYTRKKEAARWHIVSEEPKPRRKIYYASRAGDVSPVWVNNNKNTSQANKKEQKTIASISPRDIGCFSSEENESKETEALLSFSRSFSNESSSELDHSLESMTDRFYNGGNRHKNKKVTTNIKQIRRMKRYNSKNYKGSIMMVSSPVTESPPKASVLRRVIPCTVDGKLRESVAVVKKSVDPYEDFKRSMLEMILEKQMFEAKDLEELLHCFLSLNSRKYHGIIVEAFAEIWEILFL